MLQLQEFFLPRCAIRLPALQASLDLQLEKNLRQEFQTDLQSIKEKMLFDLYNKPYVTLKPVTNCTHAPVGHIRLTECACTDNGPYVWLCAYICRSRKREFDLLIFRG